MKSTDLAGRRSGSLPDLRGLLASRMLRQNAILFAGGFVGGVGGFVYHAVAAHALGPEGYGEVASLVALYSIGTSVAFVLILVLARYSASLQAAGELGAIRTLILRSSRLLAPAALALVALGFLFAGPVADFEHLVSPNPVIWLGVAMAAIWMVSVPRGVLQGTQRFTALSVNLGGEILVRTSVLVLLLKLGMGVGGSMVAILIGCLAAYAAGTFAERDLLAAEPQKVRLRSMASFAVTASIGTLGVLFLYNADVILAKHYLSPYPAGIYGGLNKIETIIYYLTLSVSQVLFPRVVEAVERRSHPGRLLLLSAGITAAMGVGSLVVFALVPGLIVRILFGPSFAPAVPLVLPVGLIGLGLSLDNLLVQFFMAVHDRIFVPLLSASCVLLVGLIAVNHAGVGSVVADVGLSVYALLASLIARAVQLTRRLRPEMVLEEPVQY